MTRWQAREVPDLTGQRAVVTGASSGVGFGTALELARAGSRVVLASRDPIRGADAERRIRLAVPGAEVAFVRLDLADLASIRRFADARGDEPLDLLVNNAGVMAVPYQLTADGFELQLATNHLGHYALTGLLLPALLQRPRPRVVTISSIAHWLGSLDFDNLMGQHGYQPWTAYAQSKLANLLFMRELHHRATGAGVGLVSAAAHPGLSATPLYQRSPGARRSLFALKSLGRPATLVLGQSAAKGALPQLIAATAPGVGGGEYFGPGGLAEFRGRPKRVRMSKNAQDEIAAERLWRVSEELTGVSYPFPTPV
jgi:NAD(P)-dependent dehydrogenase (short-subunit alcohol dehydrogenase family)